jgi:uncharacterized protein (TIGR02646 family)
MRYIKKGTYVPSCLNQQHLNPPQTPKDAESRWDSRALKKCKPKIVVELLREQYGLCCYSEVNLDDQCLGYHIEHVENKSQNPARTFDYLNLAASALDSKNDLTRFKTQGCENFGGHAAGKQQSVDMNLFISCFDPTVSSFFAYSSDGLVSAKLNLSPTDQTIATYTIDLLNLNSPYLVNLRRNCWLELDTVYEENISKYWCLDTLIELDITDSNQKLRSFFSLTRQFYGQRGEQVLHAKAPYLL